MSYLRKAAQELLDSWDTMPFSFHPARILFENLRAALAQPDPIISPEIKGDKEKPVAWGCFRDGILVEDLVSDEKSVDYWCAPDDPEMCGWTKKPLYTTPPQRQPLTEEEIHEVCGLGVIDIEFVRIVERAHGIGGNHECS